MANNRIFYACQRAGVAPCGSYVFQTLRGLQTVGVTTNFNLEGVFEWGQFDTYEQIEGVPNIEISTERVLDGSAPTYLLATQTRTDGTAINGTTLSDRAQTKCNFAMQVYPEAMNIGGVAEGTPETEVQMSGVYVSAVSYAVNVDGNATESVTLVGNNKVWVYGANTTGWNAAVPTGTGTWDTPWTTNGSDPMSISSSGGVNRREDVLFGSGYSLIPGNIPGITMINANSGCNILDGDGAYGAHISGWTTSVDFGRTELFELGRRGTYYRFATFPVEVTTEITVIGSSGDLVSAHEDGVYGSGTGCGVRYNLKDYPIRLIMCEGLQIDCGSKNKLRSVNVTGGDTGGGNVEITYSYVNNNNFDVKHPQDPVVALRHTFAP